MCQHSCANMSLLHSAKAMKIKRLVIYNACLSMRSHIYFVLNVTDFKVFEHLHYFGASHSGSYHKHIPVSTVCVHDKFIE